MVLTHCLDGPAQPSRSPPNATLAAPPDASVESLRSTGPGSQGTALFLGFRCLLGEILGQWAWEIIPGKMLNWLVVMSWDVHGDFFKC